MNYETLVVIYDHTSTSRIVCTAFELLALARRPHAAGLERLDETTFRLLAADAVFERSMLPLSKEKARITKSRYGTPFQVPPLQHDPIAAVLNDHAERTHAIGTHEVHDSDGECVTVPQQRPRAPRVAAARARGRRPAPRQSWERSRPGRKRSAR